MLLRNYVQQLPILQNFKELILDDNFLNNNPLFYKNYPSLFSQCFSVSEKNLNLLDIAGYLYYQATLFTDSLVDEGDVSNFPLIGICQEESIKILTSIYGLDSFFWKYWNLRRNEYLKAIYTEKSFLLKEYLSMEEYEELADKKSAFGKVAIDCLFNLDNKNEDIYKKLLYSHKYFSVAFQLNDDIQDFKKDVNKGQFNWAYYLLKQQNIENNNPEILEKYLYVRGIAKEIYQLGIFYCNKALELVENINVPDWKRVLLDTRKTFIIAINEIDNYLEILTAEIDLSHERKKINDIQSSIKDASNFLKNKQNEDSSWREYINQGGISNIWSTAFILSKISENAILRINFRDEIEKGLKFLSKNERNNLWGYNSTWINDADSTSFVLISLLHNNIEINPSIIEQWLKYQNETGGFSTYCDEKYLIESLDDVSIINVSGWVNSHNCVSAVSFYFLALYNRESTFCKKLREYFEINIEEKINSYWWTSSIYTLYYLSKTYCILKDFQRLDWIIEQIEKLQNVNGSFSDKYGESKFYTALAVEILLIGNNSKLKIEKAISYLLKNQYDDGSWDNSDALQVPDSKNIKPDNSLYPVSTFGMNIRAKEFYRLFSTVSVLQALTLYERKYNS